MSDGIITIKHKREKPIINQHPWIFSGAIERVENSPQAGDIVTVISNQGEFLATGYWNAKSQIQVRILTWQDEEIDEAWWRKMLNRAIETRQPHTSAQRLVNAENDYLPGLIVDRYGDWLVIQALTYGIDCRKDELAAILADILQPKGIYERSDVDVRGKEGLKPATGVLWGEEPPEYIIIEENGLKIQVDVRNGHKTGFYLDQAANRISLQQLMKPNYDVLNLFSYTGAFSLHALTMSDSQIVNVDASDKALELAESNAKLNGLNCEQCEYIQADVFHYLREVADQGQQYDIVILDPPKFANNKQQISKASRGYKDINLNAFRIIKPGGYLMTFSCSGAISTDLFQKIVFGALADSGRQAQIIKHLGANTDHPNALTFPEGDYLKGLLLKVY